ncbi:shikimate dehydrogenase family protein [Microscilla marina]|uniref:Shikimate dehydrogenase n=1 Tax=Microscilla marina ATCC 23134 TaxID=313606 RepID=A1ZKQ6_MICM2|nr:shikimate dehydrogenase [Microscilla marina]EAY28872.1 shikimate dehydrogenase [Microscilla marina ATCC 23134]
MRQFGLIGFPLSHSFSKKYFSEKFEREQIAQANYELYPLPSVDDLPQLIDQTAHLVGLNVTIPHKQTVIPLLDHLDASAKQVGAVNVIKIDADGKKTGYNSDYFGFKQSLLNTSILLEPTTQALVLGSGGASRAVMAAFDDLHLKYQVVSRKPSTDQPQQISYQEVSPSLIESHQIIVNTTPLGMHPHTDACPALPYEALGTQHLLFDLVYNPEQTLFMKKGGTQGAKAVNGLEMLHLQAEKAWEIWNS